MDKLIIIKTDDRNNLYEQKRVFQGGEEVYLTRLEHSMFVFPASNPGIVLTQTQMFESVWNMDSDSCHSSYKFSVFKDLRTF